MLHCNLTLRNYHLLSLDIVLKKQYPQLSEKAITIFLPFPTTSVEGFLYIF